MGNTLELPCTQKMVNAVFRIDFKDDSEKYFEDSTQFIAVLAYKSSTFILAYDKPTNTFRIPNDQPNLRAGTYGLTVSSIMCTPHNVVCDNCTIY